MERGETETGGVEHGRKIQMKNVFLTSLLVCTVSDHPAAVYLVSGLNRFCLGVSSF